VQGRRISRVTVVPAPPAGEGADAEGVEADGAEVAGSDVRR
jgi:hypothetical protein